ncbi:MAG TPA: hypothetical protein GXZ64_06975 [Clostridiaceae bacterium]|jgi:uncharacterized membrane protein|nr:hypothetical protein [Clostridiaceae bacterium]
MKEKLTEYLDRLFDETPPTKRAVELKEEMYRNMLEKYDDLLAAGREPQDAFDLVIASVGDPTELFRSLANEDQIQQNAEQKKRSALRTAIAVMLYILSPIPLITLAALAGQPIVGLVLLLTMAAVATGILIYDYMSKPTYNAKDETMVEEFRAWSSGTKRIKQTRDAVSSALWSLTVAIYLLISFSTGAWHITWIAFIFAAGVQTMVNLFFNLKGKDQS